MKLYSKPTTDTALSTHLRRVNDYIQQNEVTDNDGLTLEKSIAGSNYGAAEKYKNPQIVYRGEYNTSSFYQEMDMVRVLTGSSYTSASVSFTSTAGTWLCIKPTPTINSASYNELAPAFQAMYPADAIIKVGEVYAPVTPDHGYWIQLGGGGSPPVWMS